MPQRLALAACLLLITTAIAAWLWWQDFLPPPPEGNGRLNPFVTESTTYLKVGERGANSTQSKPASASLKIGTPSTDRLLTVQLLDLVTDAPWTNRLQLTVSDRHEARRNRDHQVEAPVDPSGLCTLRLPEWWRPSTKVKVTINGNNDHYRDLTHSRVGTLPPKKRIRLSVQAVASVTGRVLDSRDMPVRNAVIAAFPLSVGQPSENLLGSTTTNAQGHYRLLAPPDIRILIVAVAIEQRDWQFNSNDGGFDNGRTRSNLLPAMRPVTLDLFRSGHGCNFTLADATLISGHVQWPDRTPVANAQVQYSTKNGVRLPINSITALQWHDDDTLTQAGDVIADQSGAFVVPATNGAKVDVSIVAADCAQVVGQLPTQIATAPGECRLTLPYPTLFRVIRGTEMLPFARLLIDGHPPQRVGPGGTFQMLMASDQRVQAELGPLRSRWQTVTASEQAQTVDLVVTNELHELQLDLVCKTPVSRAALEWVCDDGRSHRLDISRNHHANPFRIPLAAGSYDLRVSASTNPQGNEYLLPINHRVSVSDDLILRLPAKVGGSFTLAVYADKESIIPRSCTARSPDGLEQSLQLVEIGKSRPSDADISRCATILRPGPYELMIDLGVHGVHKRYISIEPQIATPVILDL